MKNFINKLVFFVGWILSPLTFWNDAFVNIPISYVAASLLVHFVHSRFVMLMLVCYWLSNIVGLLMMYASGKAIISTGKGIIRELVALFITVVIYSVILILLGKTGILKPL